MKSILLILVVVILAAGAYYWYTAGPRIEIEVYENDNTTTTATIDPKAYGDNCVIQATCGNLVAVDCVSAADGPLYYVDANTKEVVGRCGGFCFNPDGCPNPCPPTEWTCQ